MNQLPESGDNKTTRAKHPDMYDEMAEGSKEFGPTSTGDGAGIAKVRAAYAKAGERWYRGLMAELRAAA